MSGGTPHWVGGAKIFVCFAAVVVIMIHYGAFDSPADGPGTGAPTDNSWSQALDAPDLATARGWLDELTVDDHYTPSRPYRRDYFGRPWTDTDGDGCDQRYDVLMRDAPNSGGAAHRAAGHCKVASITLIDPYSGETLTSTGKIQIDHVIPLGRAWATGADRWDDAQRLTYANDLSNLLAVKGSLNMSKSDDPPDEWRPPNVAAWCAYAGIYVRTAHDYRLTVTHATRAELATMLDTCDK